MLFNLLLGEVNNAPARCDDSRISDGIFGCIVPVLTVYFNSKLMANKREVNPEPGKTILRLERDAGRDQSQSHRAFQAGLITALGQDIVRVLLRVFRIVSPRPFRVLGITPTLLFSGSLLPSDRKNGVSSRCLAFEIDTSTFQAPQHSWCYLAARLRCTHLLARFSRMRLSVKMMAFTSIVLWVILIELTHLLGRAGQAGITLFRLAFHPGDMLLCCPWRGTSPTAIAGCEDAGLYGSTGHDGERLSAQLTGQLYPFLLGSFRTGAAAMASFPYSRRPNKKGFRAASAGQLDWHNVTPCFIVQQSGQSVLSGGYL